VARTVRLRKTTPPISDMALIHSGFQWTGVALPPMPGDDSRYDLEHGAAMWGIATDAEPRQACMRGKGSGRKATTDLGNMVVGWHPPATTSTCFNLLPDAFTPPLWAPRITLQAFCPHDGIGSVSLSLALDRRLGCILSQSTSHALPGQRLSLSGHWTSGPIVQRFQGRSSVRLNGGGEADWRVTGVVPPRPWKRRVAAARGQVTSPPRIIAQRPGYLGSGEIRLGAGGYLRGRGHLKRLVAYVAYKVLMC
jgi:hypothetical protein